MIATTFMICNKGRDLIDLSHSLQVFENLNAPRVVELLGLYLAVTNLAISRAEAEQRMFAKLESPAFLADVRPLLTADEGDRFDDKAARDAFVAVFPGIIRLMPGDEWARTSEMIKQLKLPEPADSRRTALARGVAWRRSLRLIGTGSRSLMGNGSGQVCI